MAMVTRCPSCGTLFRVTPQHLQAHHGQVRCGRCMTVFDGFAALATLPDQGTSEPAAVDGAETAVRGGGERAAPPRTDPPKPEADAEYVRPAAARSSAAPVARKVTDDAPGPAGTAAAPAATAVPRGTDAGHAAGPDALGGASALADPQVTVLDRRVAFAWSAGIAILILALVGQAIYAYRVELVARYPGLKPAVLRFCDLFDCRVPLPQRPKLITIEASDLQVQDQSRPGVIQLTTTLRNHAGFEVGYPALDLVLTNTKEHTLARRVFMPAEYLEPRRSGAAGLAANAEVTVRLVLDTGDLGAAGFRLALLPAQ